MRLDETDVGLAHGASSRPGRSGVVVATRPQRSLRVLVHDFAGHPFQIDLSRALARRGHTVQHVYCESYTSGKGRFDGADGGPCGDLSVVGVPAGESFARYSPVRRVSQASQPFTFRLFLQLGSDPGSLALVLPPSRQQQRSLLRFLDRACETD